MYFNHLLTNYTGKQIGFTESFTNFCLTPAVTAWGTVVHVDSISGKKKFSIEKIQSLAWRIFYAILAFTPLTLIGLSLRVFSSEHHDLTELMKRKKKMDLVGTFGAPGGPGSYKLQRIGERKYAINFDNDKSKSVVVTIPPLWLNDHETVEDDEFFYNMVEHFASTLFNRWQQNKSIKVIQSYGGSEWMLKPINSAYSLNRISSMVHRQGDHNVVNLEITRLPSTALNPEKLEKCAVDQALKNPQQDCRTQSKMLVCTEDEIREGVRGKFIKPSLLPKDRVEDSFYSNPFTALSELAFQRYEKEFSGNDHFKPEDCRYCLVLKDDEVVLTKNSDQVKADKEMHIHTVNFYKGFLTSEFGEENVAYAEKICRISFEGLIKTGMPLTPEHVYRLNIALNNIEACTINAFLRKIPDIEKNLSTVDPALSIEDAMDPLTASELTIREIRGMIRRLRLQSPAPSVGDTLNFLETFKNKYRTEDLNSRELNQLTEIFFPSKAEYEKIFTGRSIYFPIGGNYTIAQLNVFKPWIDQQELLQVFPRIQNTSNWDLYNELLAQIVVKKHLFREHPDKGYVTGALIPAPLDEEGNPRWFKVTEAVYNGYGMLCYTLEPACKDSSLPSIKLYRNTSVNPYVIFGEKSIRSDFNPLAPAGYEGMGRADEYEETFFKDRTIPLWVGQLMDLKEEYTTQPQTIENAQNLYAKLDAATKTLVDSEQPAKKALPIEGILSKHSGILNTLFLTGAIASNFFYELKNRYASKSKKKMPFGQKKIDIKKLYQYVNIYRRKQKVTLLEEGRINEIKSLHRDLRGAIDFKSLKAYSREFDYVFLQRTLKHIKDRATGIQEDCKKCLSAGNVEDSYIGINRWIQVLDSYARGIGESIADKKPQDVLFVGHSLGGSCSQAYFLHHLMKKNRIPVPGKKVKVAAFDAPGISYNDNQFFKEFLFKNSQLLNNLKITFEIYHQHEAGDPVPLAGSHLGTAYTLEEAGKVLMNLGKFRGSVLKRNPDTKNPVLALANVVHDTRFLEGIEGVDYTKREVDPYELGLKEDYENIHDLPDSLVQQKGYSLRSKVWAFPLALTPRRMEQIRSNPTLYARTAGYFPHWIKHEEHIRKFLDSNGNFGVGEQGLMLRI
jgi:hypothetical protein